MLDCVAVGRVEHQKRRPVMRLGEGVADAIAALVDVESGTTSSRVNATSRGRPTRTASSLSQGPQQHEQSRLRHRRRRLAQIVQRHDHFGLTSRRGGALLSAHGCSSRTLTVHRRSVGGQHRDWRSALATECRKNRGVAAEYGRDGSEDKPGRRRGVRFPQADDHDAVDDANAGRRGHGQAWARIEVGTTGQYEGGVGGIETSTGN